MTAVRQLWIARIIYIMGVLFIFSAFVYDVVAGALCFGGCVLLYISADDREVWSAEINAKLKRLDKQAAKLAAFSKDE